MYNKCPLSAFMSVYEVVTDGKNCLKEKLQCY